MKNFKPQIAFFILCSLLVFGGVKAQVTSFYNPLNPFKISQGDIFNINVILNPNIPTQTVFKLHGLIINKQSGVILDAVSQEFTLKAGNNSIPSLNLNVTYNIKDKLVGSTGLLPYGLYRFECQLTDKFNEPISFCETDIDILPLTPPQLAFPDDRSSIENTLPTLFWIPPFPIPSTGIIYQLRMTEILFNQTSNEALTLNLPILDVYVNDVNTYQYSPNNMPLSFGKSYSWQVIALDKSGTKLGTTEIWEFSITKDVKRRNSDSNYVVIKKENLQRTFKTEDKNLYIKFEENYKSGNLDFAIKTLDGKPVECENSLLKESGENRITLSFSSCTKIKAGDIYIIDIKLNKNNTYSIRTLID